LPALATCSLALPAAAQRSADREIRETVQAFYGAFNNHDLSRAVEFTTTDWVDINPLGGWTRGRDAVLAELREVHRSFLKGATDTPDTMVVRMTGAGSAVVTVLSDLSPYVTPDGIRHEHERQIRTFVVARDGRRWRIAQDQNTIVRP
jgi:uncharacterized protein (TIGR02246 family)